MSDTPRTDKECGCDVPSVACYAHTIRSAVSADFARTLERELATATEQLQQANVNAWDMERQRDIALQQRDEIQEEYVRMRGERDGLRAELAAMTKERDKMVWHGASLSIELHQALSDLFDARKERDELRAELDRINALITVRTNP